MTPRKTHFGLADGTVACGQRSVRVEVPYSYLVGLVTCAGCKTLALDLEDALVRVGWKTLRRMKLV